jgi:hypothetical protein
MLGLPPPHPHPHPHTRALIVIDLGSAFMVIDLGSAFMVIDLGSAFIVIVWLYVDSGRLDSPWRKDLIFHTPPIVKMQTILGKSPTFFESPFSCERDRQPALKFDMDLNVLIIYRLIPRTHELLESNISCISFFS